MAKLQETAHNKNLSVVLPVYNEESVLEPNILKLLSYMNSAFTCEWEIVIADNFSTDKTSTIGHRLAELYPQVKYVRINRKGVGIALKTAWTNFPADIHCHVDGDLPFDLEDMKQVIQAAQNSCDICVGSRFADGGHNDAKPMRQLFSKIFHLWIKLLFSYEFSDICGIKAVRRAAFLKLSPHLSSDGWFFNTEIVLLADNANMSIKEVPVRVKEPPGRKSKVKVLQTSTNLLFLTSGLKVKFWFDKSFRQLRRVSA